MIEIIRAARSIIPVMELTFLSLHMYLYSKSTTKQFEAATAHNQWSDMEKAVALTVHPKGAAQQMLAAMPQSDTIEYTTLVKGPITRTKCSAKTVHSGE